MVRFGIIGCGTIAHKMADALSRCAEAELVAVAARDKARAETFAAEVGAPRAFGSYEELVRDPEIDAVYVATIHPAHAAAVTLCLNAGKHVLCEKPMAMTRAEGEAMFKLAREKGLLLMEAIWSRFLPAWRHAKTLIDEGAIGPVKSVFTDFSICAGFDPESRLYNREKGGGSLLDLGVYSLHCALYALGNDVKTVKALGRLAPTGTDCYAAVTLQTADGGIAVASCGMDCPGGAGEGRIMGANGTLILRPLMGADTCIVQRGGQPDEVLHFPYENGFVFEVEEFCGLFSQGKTESAIATPEATLTVAGVIDEAIAQLNAAEN